MPKNKSLLFSLTAKDFRFDFFAAASNGGQNAVRNKNCCRVVHEPSRATGISRDERSQLQNKQLAFKRCAESKKFQTWIRLEASKRLGNPTPEMLAEQAVEDMFRKPEDFKFEIQVGKNEWETLTLEEMMVLPSEEVQNIKIK